MPPYAASSKIWVYSVSFHTWSFTHTTTRYGERWLLVSQGGLFSYAVNYIVLLRRFIAVFVFLTKLYAYSQAESSSLFFHFPSFLSDFFVLLLLGTMAVDLKYTSCDSIPGLVQELRQSFSMGTSSSCICGVELLLILLCDLYVGLTKDVSFRKQQLRNLQRFCEEHTETIQKALYADLRKHTIETGVGEISLVVEECRYMIKVHTYIKIGFVWWEDGSHNLHTTI